jgi:ribA/ribD-fused uncharacterized protein
MPRGKASNSDNLSEKYDEIQIKILDSLNKLTIKVDTLSTKVAKCDQTGEEIKHSIDDCLKSCKDSLLTSNQNKAEINKLKTELNLQNNENSQLKTKLLKLEDRIIRIESQSRRNILLIDGIKESDNEDCTEQVKTLFKITMKLTNVDNMQIVRCHRLGEKRQGALKPRTVIIKFQWFGDRMQVWKARKELKGSNVYLNEDFPKEIQEKRSILWPILQKARQKGMLAFLNVDTLTIDGKRYTSNDLGKLPTDLDPAKIATKEVGDNMLVFFGGQSPLSNFHKSNFVVNGIEYDCNERFYVHSKAEFADDPAALAAVMKVETPQEIKRISNGLNKNINVKVWMAQSANKVMMEGVKAKFCQNAHLKTFLLGTGEKTLVEANPYDVHWSCGLSIKDPNTISDTANW